MTHTNHQFRSNLIRAFKQIVGQPLQRKYRQLFEYDEARLTIYSQKAALVLSSLAIALLYRRFVLLTYFDGQDEIGQIVKRLSPTRFVVRSSDRKVLHYVDVNQVFRVDFP